MPSTVDYWVGSVDSNWSTPGNWSTGVAPHVSDTADFTSSFSMNSTVNVDQAVTVGSVVIDSTWSGTLNVNNPLTVSGNFQMSSGTLNATAATSIAGSSSGWNGGQINLGTGGFTNTGTLAGSATGGLLNLNGNGTFTNSGTMTFQGGNFRLENGAIFDNAASTGVFDFTDNSLIIPVGQTPGVFNNAGTLEKTGGGGTSYVQSVFNNSGTIAATMGTLAIDPSGGQNTGGTFNVSTGALVDLTGGTTVHYKGTYTGSGAGTVALGGGTLVVDSGGATFNFSAGLFQWAGSAMIDVSSGSLTNTGVININTSTTVYLNGANSLLNAGTVTQQGSGTFELENGATFNNESGAIYDLLDNSNINETGSGPNMFLNAGTLEKTGGTGSSLMQSGFSNSHAITVTAGTLVIYSDGGQNTGGTFTISAGATLDLTGGRTVHYKGTYTGTGTGTISLNSGTLAVDSGGATFNMAGSLFKWSGTGVIDVTNGDFTNTGTITITATGTVTLNGVTSGNNATGELINSKTINQTAAGNLQIENGATVLNKGTYSLAADASIVSAGSGPNTFTNTKTLQKTAGTGTSTISCTLNNTGTVLAKNGTVSITGTVTQISGTTLTAGTWNVTGTATVHPTLTISTMIDTLGTKAKVTLSGPHVTSGTHQGQPVFSNLASVRTILAGGSLTLTGGVGLVLGGALTNNGLLTLNAGDVLTINGAFTEASTATLTIQLGGTNTVPSFGQIVSSGPVVLAGKLVLKEKSASLNYTPPQTLQFITNSGVNSTTGNFTNLPDGSTITVGTTYPMTFTIHYNGGDRNDVTLSL